MSRVAFIEFASIDRFHRGVWIPFALGMLRDASVDSIWIRFGVRADTRVNQCEPGLSLPDVEVGPLVERLRQFAATHVVFDRLPAPSLHRAIEEAGPFRMAFVSESREGEEQGLPCLPPSPGPLASFVGLDAQRTPTIDDLFDEIVPHFSWSAGNEAATKAPSLPFLVCGEECTFCAPIRRNPCFTNLDTKTCGRQYGCSFCVRPSGRARWKHAPVELFRRQMKALRDSHPPWFGPLLVRAVGEPVIRNVEAVADVLVDLDLPPVALLLDGRADTILHERDSLERALVRLRPTPHALHMSLVGIESFVADELLLYNKGLRWDQNLDAIAALVDLEHRYGEHFDSHTYGGLSLILQSPWTRPEHLSANLAIIRRAGLAPLTGKLFTSRLRLYPSLPLYALARKDGLVIDTYQDPLLDTARKNLYDDEVPWRFRHPGMETISRLFVRMEGAGEGDRLALALREALADGGGLDGQLALAEALVDCAMERPERSALDVVRAAAQRANEPKGRKTGRGADGSHDAERDRELVALAMSVGLKPVARVEHEAPERPCGSGVCDFVPVVKRRLRATSEGTEQEVFVGLDEALVDEAVALTDIMDCTRDDARWQQCARRVGVLLGYPECCADAFAKQSPAVRSNYTWAHLMARLRQPGPVDPLLNPGMEAVSVHVPCSLTCQPTLERCRALLEAIREHSGARVADALVQSSRRPWILLLDEQAVGVEIIPEGEPLGRFPYRSGVVRGEHPLLRAVCQGDELEVDEQNLLVLQRGRVTASLGARAFVWWHERIVQPELLSRLVSLRFAPGRDMSWLGGGGEASAGALAEAQSLFRFVRRVCREHLEHKTIAGFRLASLTLRKKREVVVVLRSPSTTLHLVVALRHPGVKGYVAAGPFVVIIDRDHPIRRAEQDRAARRFAHFLASARQQRARHCGS